jgi:hypothetical protein
VAAALILTSVRASDEARPPELARGAMRQSLRLLARDGYVMRLAWLSGLAASALLCADYLFKSTAAHAIAPARLGSFFAIYYTALNAASLLMQLLVSGLVIRRLGVVPALSLLPLLLCAFGTGSFLLGAPLALVIALKASDGALRHSIQRVANELVQMPLSASLHEQVKGFIDGTLPRLAQALTAGALLFIASLSGAPERWVALSVALISAAWLGLAIGLRTPYLQRFRDALQRPNTAHGLMVQELDADAIEAVLEALSSRDPARVISAMELLEDKQRVRLIPALVLYHEDEAVLSRALDMFAASERQDWIEHAERLLSHASEAVRVSALRAFSLRGRHTALERGLSDPSLSVRAQAAFWLVTLDQNPEPLGDPRIMALLELSGSDGATARKALLSAVRDAPAPRWTPVLLAAAAGEDELVFEQAALAMAKIADPSFVPLLIEHLSVQEGRAAVRDALVALGEPALRALTAALAAPATNERVRRQIPRAIAGFRSQHAADVLLGQLDRPEHSGLLRYRVLRGLGRLVAETRVRVDRAAIDLHIKNTLVEHLRLLAIRNALGPEQEPGAQRSRRLVLGLLEAKQEQSLERAFHLLQIRHPSENIRAVHYALRSEDRRKRAYALEFLDTMTTTSHAEIGAQVRSLLLVVADDLAPAEKVQRAASMLPALPRGHSEALRGLIADHDEYLASFAAYHALELGGVDLEQAVVSAVQKRPELNRIGDSEALLFPVPLTGAT